MSVNRRPTHPARLATLLTLAALAAACSAGTAGPSESPGGASGPPSATPVSGIEHPTGATDVVLRYEEGGGFVPASFAASSTPHFTLYGDGRVIFRDPSDELPPAVGSVFRMNPMRAAQVSEEQVQELLAFALGEGGLAAARPEYLNQMVSDASTAVFTIDAGGIRKAVSVYALGLEMPEGQPDPDGPARAAFAKLAARLTDLDQGGTISTDVYAPAAYRGILLESPGAVAPDIREWPWPELTPADFTTAEGRPFPSRTMTPEELEILGIDDFEGGYQGMLISGPDGKTYAFSLRPLLPDESA